MRFAKDAVQPLQLGRRHLLAAVDDRRRARIRGPGLRLLLVGQRQHAQGQDLVDLGRVEHRTGALRGDRGVVVQDDRRREDDVRGLPLRVPRRRPGPASSGAGVQRSAAARASSGGSITETNRAPVGRQQQVGADQRGPQRGVLVTRGAGGVRDGDPQAQQPVVVLGAQRHRGAQRLPAADQPAARHRLHVLAARDLDPDGHARAAGPASAKPPRSRSTSTASSQVVQVRRRPTRARRPARTRRRPVARSACLRCSWRNRRCTRDRARHRPRHAAGTGRRGRAPPRSPRPPRPAGRARRTASAPGSWPRWTGRGRAGTPRRGRRRRRAGRGRAS